MSKNSLVCPDALEIKFLLYLTKRIMRFVFNTGAMSIKLEHQPNNIIITQKLDKTTQIKHKMSMQNNKHL